MSSLPPPFEAYTGEEPYLFVSYAHADSAVVFPELVRLQEAGYRIWYDEGIDPGNEWPEEIAKALAAAAFVLVFVTPNAVESRNVRNEINYALNHGTPFVAVHLEPIDLPPGLALRMGDIQAVLKWRMDDAMYQRKMAKTLPEEVVSAGDGTSPPPVGIAAGPTEAAFAAGKADVVVPDVPVSAHTRRRPVPVCALVAVIVVLIVGALVVWKLAFRPAASAVASSAEPTSQALAAPAGGSSSVNPSADGKLEEYTGATTRPGTKAGQEAEGPDGATYVWVPPGQFMMGSNDGPDDEKPVHTVRITRGFWLGKCEVTNARYKVFCLATGRSFPSGSTQGAEHPVAEVIWEDAEAYCQQYGLPLPTEAEWEYAARGAAGRTYPWGNEWDKAKCCNAENKGVGGQTHPVGSFSSGTSWCGALDLAGNVWEWCADSYAGDYYRQSPARDPLGAASVGLRVLRGGSWGSDDIHCRSGCRENAFPSVRIVGGGFRCVAHPKLS